jgi:hypothetical protein
MGAACEKQAGVRTKSLVTIQINGEVVARIMVFRVSFLSFFVSEDKQKRMSRIMTFGECVDCGSLNKIENAYLMLCAGCNYARRKADRTKAKEPSKAIKKVSDNKAKENQVYAKLRKEYMEIHPVCECCKKANSTECHHMRGRGEYFLNPDYYLAVCEPCHRRITEDSAWAIASGFSYLRTEVI